MKAYTKFVYKSRVLYQSDDGQAFIALAFSDKKSILLQLKLMLSIFKIIPPKVRKIFFGFVKEIQNDDKTYTKHIHLETLMVCVNKQVQGQSRSRELVDFAKQTAESRNVPLLFDTDMKEYAEMYEHFDCEVYHTKTASNGITRYHLVWKP